MLFNQIQNLFVIVIVYITFAYLCANNNSSSVVDDCSKAPRHLGALE